MVVASLLLLLLFLFPIWHIKLDAPQYPEGINMYIWINNINGKSSFSATEDELSIHTIENAGDDTKNYPGTENGRTVFTDFTCRLCGSN